MWFFSGSYARGCAVHNSFNRATTIHGVTDLLIEKNVMFDIKGLSFFIEDGIEEDNILQYNLAIYTKQSSRYDHYLISLIAFTCVSGWT